MPEEIGQGLKYKVLPYTYTFGKFLAQQIAERVAVSEAAIYTDLFLDLLHIGLERRQTNSGYNPKHASFHSREILACPQCKIFYGIHIGQHDNARRDVSHATPLL